MTKDKYIKEMREYWEKTRGSGILGTTASFPDSFDEKLGEYYDNNIDTWRECELCGKTTDCEWCECEDCTGEHPGEETERGRWLCPNCCDPLS